MMSPTDVSGESACPAQGYAMRLPSFSRRQLAIAAFTVTPFAVMVGPVLAARIYWNLGTRRLNGGELFLIYLGFFTSLNFGRSLRYPLINPCSRWGILGPRKQPRAKLWNLVLYIALISPMFAFYAQMMQEHRLEREAWNAKRQAFADEMIARHSEQEQLSLARAQKAARAASVFREKEARGDKQEGQMSWGERAKRSEDNATFWRGQAASDAALRKSFEQQGENLN
jgi:hypothetical protein